MNELLTQYQTVCPYYESNCVNLQCPCPKYKAYVEAQKPEVLEQVLSEMNVNPHCDPLNKMLGMQRYLGSLFHPMEGLSKEEVDKWVNAYVVCIEDELREVREHLNWKPWSQNVKENEKELKKELIDIWHFWMDMALVVGIQDSKTVMELYEPTQSLTTPELYLEFIMNQERAWMSKYHRLENLTKEEIDWLLLFYQNCMQDALGQVRQHISWKHWKKPSPTIDYPKLQAAVIQVLKYLVDMMILVKMSVSEWVDTYVNKNVENVLRNKFGY